MSSNNATKALSQVLLILITRPQNHLLNNKRLIDLPYNEMESLISSFSWCNVQSVSSNNNTKLLSQCDNH